MKYFKAMAEMTPEELRFFRDEGYVIKRKVMDEELMAQARERIWQNLPPGIDRDDSSTWRAPAKALNDVKREKLPRTIETDYSFDGWALPNPPSHNDEYAAVDGTSWKYRTIGTEQFLVQMLLTDSVIWDMAEQMLGRDSLAIPTRTRGIYCRFPNGDIPVKPLKPHTDGHEFHLGVLGYLDDVPADGGAFTIWPKTHRVFYYQHLTQYGGAKADSYERYYNHLKEQTATECYGDAGDIVFFHHRLAHAGNPPNCSNEIRKVVIGDLVKKDLRHMLDEPPLEDMWEQWPGIPTDGK